MNKLSHNISKTNYILFGNYRCEKHVALRIGDVNIEIVEATEFLGVIIDEQLYKIRSNNSCTAHSEHSSVSIGNIG